MKKGGTQTIFYPTLNWNNQRLFSQKWQLAQNQPLNFKNQTQMTQI